MVITKRHTLRIFFMFEIVIFVGIYFFSAQGLRILQGMQQENEQVQDKIGFLKDEIAVLEEEVSEWENNSFYKEKIAREELQVAKQGDEVYFL
ncbi:MAG: cell division protein FtsB [Alteromonas naphthalenivorans]|jgi:cell division protein FtsB